MTPNTIQSWSFMSGCYIPNFIKIAQSKLKCGCDCLFIYSTFINGDSKYSPSKFHARIQYYKFDNTIKTGRMKLNLLTRNKLFMFTVYISILT